MKNQFVIDLSALDLSKEQILSIDAAIQKAVSSELAKTSSAKGAVSLIPLNKPKGGEESGYTVGYVGKI